jgi:hypothetical protein
MKQRNYTSLNEKMKSGALNGKATEVKIRERI